MKSVIICSDNPVKLRVVQSAFAKILPDDTFEFIQLAIESQSVEPLTAEGLIEEIGKNITDAKQARPEGDYFVSLQGGMIIRGDICDEVARVMIENHDGQSTQSNASSFTVPPPIAEKVKNGIDFATAVSQYIQQPNSKTGNGFVGTLTNDAITKFDHYLQPTIICLAMLCKPEWYQRD